ncbi:SufE family protein [Gimesia sp.]|uniref:SufE family protein n=1 Tax=Gimesia sp. TaxID=2024833 RepID=UPI000C678BA0|nr:SufE family protein [Gimesia sp.]MAX35081.1 Fe-S cluster assembly protein SufE [Gimesia sp.]HAH47044.1 Fe-S cluster assembly protein SufE [Planctomycetaceae bacterium]HBL43856.1 Fe-S cluster assembly protein SufE [Planctomycetaceae bacterium]
MSSKQNSTTADTTQTMITINELIEEFEFLHDWEERCDFLIDLGFELPDMPESDKTEANRVHGCQSMVWLTTELKNREGENVLHINADSDALIVKGLIAVLLAIYNDKTPKEILKTDVRQYFSQLQLDKYLSSQRKNGLFGMVERVQREARHVAEGI